MKPGAGPQMILKRERKFRMSRALRFAFPVLAAVIAVIDGTSAAFAATWSSSAQWASWWNA